MNLSSTNLALFDGGASHAEFKMAFWHPFGPHGRETQEEILKRKQAEIERNGWTLWSFQHRLILKDWHREILSSECRRVFVFCSKGTSAKDPAREGTEAVPIDCQSCQYIGDEDQSWEPLPTGVRVPHPFRPGKKLASAFVVQRIFYPVEKFQPPSVEWFSKQGSWSQTMVPTRGEYLIRQGGGIVMRKPLAVLELKAPYLAIVCADAATVQL